MLKAGDVLENPVTGERAVVRVGSAESGGELLVADLHVRPGGAVMGEHLHPRMEESFTVVRGRLGYRLDRREGVAGPGERLHLPHGSVHDWWNAGEEEAHFVCEVRPAMQFEALLETMFALAADGKTNRKGMPNPLRLAVIARHHFDDVRLPFPPAWMQRFGLARGAPAGRVLGYGPTYVPVAEPAPAAAY